jgi:peptide/nickel transport system substrate-binding protein
MSLVAVLALALVGCSAPAPEVDVPESLRIGVMPDANFDFSGDSTPLNLSLTVLDAKAPYEGLFAPGSAAELGGFQPVLATGFERSDDWKTITVTLRDDVTFVDGETLTAPGVVAYLEGMATTDSWWFIPTWERVSPTLTALNDTTFEISSDTPLNLGYGQFVHTLFAFVPILSPKTLDDLDSGTPPAGTGPYILESSTPDVGATFVRNNSYWNPEAYPFDNIEMTIFTDEIAALNALSSGQIDAVKLYSKPLVEQAKSQGLTLNMESAPSIYVLYIADREGTVVPALADKRVRQAISLAFDREAIRDTLNLGYGWVSTQPFVETQPEYVEGGDDRYAYDPKRARQLLAEAGYPDGFDLAILGGGDYAPIVIQSLADIGIRATVDSPPGDGWWQAASNPSKYGAQLGGGVPPNLIPAYAAGTAFFNAFKVQDPKFNRLWDVIQNGPDAAAASAAKELGEYVLDEAFFTVTAVMNDYWVTAPGFAAQAIYEEPDLSGFTYTG